MKFVYPAYISERITTTFLNIRIQLALLSILLLLSTLLTVVNAAGIRNLPEILAGCILSTTNAFLGYVFIGRAFRYNSNMFFVYSFAGMVVRFFLMVILTALILVFTNAGTEVFIISFMLSYTLFMFAEVLHINRKLDQLRPARVRVR